MQPEVQNVLFECISYLYQAALNFYQYLLIFSWHSTFLNLLCIDLKIIETSGVLVNIKMYFFLIFISLLINMILIYNSQCRLLDCCSLIYYLIIFLEMIRRPCVWHLNCNFFASSEWQCYFSKLSIFFFFNFCWWCRCSEKEILYKLST